MNREIKFRAWNPDDMKMEFPIVISICSNGKMQPLIKCSDGNNAYKDFPLMQFTGLKDKRGKEIYEGDILKLTLRLFWDDEIEDCRKHEDLVYVKSNSLTDTKCYYCKGGNKWDNGMSYLDWDDDWSYDNNEIEIIGNIHESPELLTP